MRPAARLTALALALPGPLVSQACRSVRAVLVVLVVVRFCVLVVGGSKVRVFAKKWFFKTFSKNDRFIWFLQQKRQ